jgi:hypothetical protein
MTDQNHTITETEAEALDAIYGDLAPQHDSPEAVEAMLLEMAETDGLETASADELRTRLAECRAINRMMLREIAALNNIIERLTRR